MNRRTLLAHMGTVAAIGSAGCHGGAALPGTSATETPADNRSETPVPTIADQRCPPLETERKSTVCSHTVDPDSASVYIEAAPENAALNDGTPVEEITLTLHNQSSTELIFNPLSWSVWLDQGNGWEQLQQELSGNARLTVLPETTHSWTLTEVVASIREAPDFKPGLYVAEIGVPNPDISDDWISCAALIRLNVVT